MAILRIGIDAPMMGAGGVAIGSAPALLPIPGRSLVTGLLAAALGIERHEADRLQRLQDGIDHAVVFTRRCTPFHDYHTTDLGQPHMAGPWLMSGGRAFDRGGSSVAEGTVVRLMPYLSDIGMVLFIAVHPSAGANVEQLADALMKPRWPLYLGRKNCPAGWLDVSLIEIGDLSAAVADEPGVQAWRPPNGGESPSTWLPDRRDWRSRRHAGSTPYVIERRGTSSDLAELPGTEPA